MALGVSRSHVLTLIRRKADWQDKRKAAHVVDDNEILADIRVVVDRNAAFGYRRVWGTLRNLGIDGQLRKVNHKRVYRVMRDHALLLYRHGMRPEDQRKHEGKVAVPNSNQRWCSDGLEIGCDNGERVRVAFALDCCDREIMSWVATTRGIDSGLIGDLMMQAVEYRFGIGELPQNQVEWLTDNGSCYTAKETRKFAKGLNLKPITTPVVSPQSNGMAESFVKTLKRDYAALANKPDSATVMQQLPEWFERYNTEHPHSALGYLPPRMFREKRRAAN